MPTTRIRSANVPTPMRGWVCIDRRGIPRFWATLWSDILNAAVSEGTRRRHLFAIDKLYRYVEERSGADHLDELLTSNSFDELEELLAGFLAELRNESLIQEINRASAWSTAVKFVLDVLRFKGSAPADRSMKTEERLRRMEAIYTQLSPPEHQPAQEIRALPAVVVEDLYAIFDPNSERNPFKTERLRWRNLLVFLLLLQMGLRRGEVALLRVDSFRTEFDSARGAPLRWVNVTTLDDEAADPRAEAPSLKTVTSTRFLPVSKELMELHDLYLHNFRGRVHHPFLISSQKKSPLALRSLQEVFEIASRHLSQGARRVLEDRGRNSVSCHDIRHTAAVIRLTRYMSKHNDIDLSTEKLRSFFGWAPKSPMPSLYARAYYEPHFADLWNETFDSLTSSLRSIEGKTFAAQGKS